MEGPFDKFDIARAPVFACSTAAGLPELRIEGDRDHVRNPVGRELLAVHCVRRRLERGARTSESAMDITMEMTRQLVHELRELVAALDRRAPQVLRAGEAAIARDAEALRARAVERIQELEREEAEAQSR